MSRNKIKTIYLHFLKTHKNQTWHNSDLGWGAPTDKVSCPFDHVTTWCHVTKNITYPIPQDLYESNLTQLWFSLRGSLLPSHIHLWSCAHGMERDKTKTLCLLFRKTHKNQIWHSGILSWGAQTYQDICPFDHVVAWCHVTKWELYTYTSTRPISIQNDAVMT